MSLLTTCVTLVPGTPSEQKWGCDPLCCGCLPHRMLHGGVWSGGTGPSIPVNPKYAACANGDSDSEEGVPAERQMHSAMEFKPDPSPELAAVSGGGCGRRWLCSGGLKLCLPTVVLQEGVCAFWHPAGGRGWCLGSLVILGGVQQDMRWRCVIIHSPL